MRISDELRKRARTEFVPVSIYDMLGFSEGFIADCNRVVPHDTAEELAFDGVQLIEAGFDWYLGPLDE